MIKNKNKCLEWLLFTITAFVFGASLFFQYVKGMQPCPLCLMQRLCAGFSLLFCFFILVSKTPPVISRLLITNLFFAGAGLYFAGRQLWLMSLPSNKLPACMPGLDVLMAYFPWQTIAKALFWGAGDCAEGKWHLWGMSMPGWTALYFTGMLAGCLYLYKRNR